MHGGVGGGVAIILHATSVPQPEDEHAAPALEHARHATQRNAALSLSRQDKSSAPRSRKTATQSKLELRSAPVSSLHRPANPREIPPFLSKLSSPDQTTSPALPSALVLVVGPVAVGGWPGGWVVLLLGCPPRRRPPPASACRCQRRPATRPARAGATPIAAAAADERPHARRPPWTPCPAPLSSSTTAPGTPSLPPAPLPRSARAGATAVSHAADLLRLSRQVHEDGVRGERGALLHHPHRRRRQ